MTKESDKIITNFIKKFDKVKEFFLTGGCYYFAVILKERFHYFPHSIIYDPIDGHFMIRLCGDALYDARGNVTELYKYNDKLINWDSYCYMDPEHFICIHRDCIEMRNRED